jgi:hypothetical protein
VTSAKLVELQAPKTWANDGPVSSEDVLRIALLRVAGCTCERPLLGNVMSDTEPGQSDGPRCRVCNVGVRIARS